MRTINDEDFTRLIGRRSTTLLGAVNYLSRHASDRSALTRPLLGELLSQSTQIEELLDACGARNNRRWHGFRSLVATIKRVADVSYDLLHIKHVLPSYRLLPIEQDFAVATDEALAFCADALLRVSCRLLDLAPQLGLSIPAADPHVGAYGEELPGGVLPQDRDTREVESVAETVAELATAFLNLASESEMVHSAGRAKPEEYASCIPDPVSEKNLRYLKHRFHNLQALYDTNVSETQTEVLDPDLPVLRGHISVLYHLLKMGTEFVHYYERHVCQQAGRVPVGQDSLVDPEALLATLMEYCIAYGSRYLACAQGLCHEMLKRYAEVGSIEVPVPRYRGFHVRPSTLVVRIVMHYGSEVSMWLDGDAYDAGSTLDIFRANEKINARKRRGLASKISEISLADGFSEDEDVKAAARRIIMILAERGEIVIYEQPLRLRDEPVRKDGTFLERVVDEIIALQTTGKIDVNIDLNATLKGDKRVLADIELLARFGYGEDNFGNNIPLPEKLAYLRR